MNTHRHRLLLPLLLIVLGALLPGCAVAPRTTALQTVHESYRTEFLALLAPAPTADQAAVKTGGANFARTLADIREFRTAQADASPAVLAHLTVLEGMIYLQSRQTGMARLMRDDVAAAAAQLTAPDGESVRDRLFAQCFPGLVEGWTEIGKLGNRPPAPSPQAAAFENAAQAIATTLREASDDQRIAAAADDGAIYLATTTAIFSTWAYRIQESGDASTDRALRERLLKPAHELMGRFLSDTEKEAAAELDAAQPIAAPRLRYMQWFRWLGEQVGR